MITRRSDCATELNVLAARSCVALHLIISLCPGCHVKVSRTRVVLSEMPPLLLELWREQHPHGHEQTKIDFTTHPGKQLNLSPLAS